jgi:hypothetical protein
MTPVSDKGTAEISFVGLHEKIIVGNQQLITLGYSPLI